MDHRFQQDLFFGFGQECVLPIVNTGSEFVFNSFKSSISVPSYHYWKTKVFILIITNENACRVQNLSFHNITSIGTEKSTYFRLVYPLISNCIICIKHLLDFLPLLKFNSIEYNTIVNEKKMVNGGTTPSHLNALDLIGVFSNDAENLIDHFLELNKIHELHKSWLGNPHIIKTQLLHHSFKKVSF